MSDQNKKQGDNRSATQRLSDLENAAMSLFNVNDNLARDVMTLKEALKLLDNKVNSIVKATASGEPLTDAVLTRIMTENNVAELAQKVTNMVTQGFIVAEEQVSENSFIVASELNDKDEVVNPRLQFALKALSPELQSKLLGVKVGDTLSIKEGLKVKLLESYSIQEPKAPETPALTVAPTETPAEAVPEVAQPEQQVVATEGQ